MLLAVLLMVSAGCAARQQGMPTAAPLIDIAAASVTLAQEPDVVSGDDAAKVAAVLADLEDFWSDRLGERFHPPTAGYALIDSAAAELPDGAMCVSDQQSLRGNAFYCPGQDGVVIDAAALVPVLLHSYGPGGLAAAIAHEYGHVIQARIGPTIDQQRADPDRYPLILVEGQADCAAGAFLHWVAAGKAVRLQLPSSMLLAAVGPLLDFRDSADRVGRPQDGHGLGLDRLRSVLRGYSGGARACREMTAESMHPTLGRTGTETGDQARFAGTAAVTAAAARSVADFLTARDGSPGTVVTPDPAVLAAAAPYGQFAEAAATAFATGLDRFGDTAGAACFTGAWTAAVFGTADPGQLGSRPGDADEAMDLIRARPGARWDQLVAFAAGFDDGRAGCS